MTTYEYFKFPDLDAMLGLGSDEGLIYIQVRSSGGTGDGASRNLGRSQAFERLLAWLDRASPPLQVICHRSGKGAKLSEVNPEKPWTDDQLRSAFKLGGGFKFVLILGGQPELTAPILAEKLGLVPVPDQDRPTRAIKIEPLPAEARQRGGVPAADSATAASGDSNFRKILKTIDEGGLYFPAETVANVLLAMQVKRFVILTGISGTGKTRIAQAIAGRFPLMRKVAVPHEEEDTRIVTVSADAVKRGRIVLPASLCMRMPAVVGQQGAGSIKVRWGGDEAEVATYKRDADRPSGLVVLFSGSLAAWFGATFSEGSKLVVGLDGPPDRVPDTITLATPQSEKLGVERLPNAAIIPVRPDWTDNRGLLGFYNPLTRKYVTTPFLRLLLAAKDEVRRAAAEKRPPHPFFVLFDEMNLARVEHYFSDLLSAMESVADGADENGGILHLHDEESLEEGESEDEEPVVPRRLRVPPNLFIVGTVNVDESTYMFSPKVLDRAFTIEFNAVDLGGLGKHIEDSSELDLVRWDGKLAPPRPSGRDDWRWLTEHRNGSLGAQLVALHVLLASANRHFGYRVACEIARFVRLAVEQVAADDASAKAAERAALDLAVLQKVLVKLAGTQAELSRLLDDLLWFTLLGRRTVDAERNLGHWRLDAMTGEVVPSDAASKVVPVFPRSAAKLWRMRSRLLERGFTSWIE